MRFDENQIYDLFLKETNIGRLQKIITKYEIFKHIINVPGDICEAKQHCNVMVQHCFSVLEPCQGWTELWLKM